MPHFRLEIDVGGKDGRVAGVDEVGRGPWAGPVVACAAVLDKKLPRSLRSRIDDSKALTAKKREEVAAELVARAKAGEGVVLALAAASVAEIDRINILHASERAMTRALNRLPFAPDHVLVDGNRIPPDCAIPAKAVVGGDGRSLSIAAASIVAKVARDRLMARLAAFYPGFGWERNAGYGTEFHAEALTRLGPTAHHRRSFAPVAEAFDLFARVTVNTTS
jgi:ribonuclease HII